jgi:hypothetical protein
MPAVVAHVAIHLGYDGAEFVHLWPWALADGHCVLIPKHEGCLQVKVYRLRVTPNVLGEIAIERVIAQVKPHRFVHVVNGHYVNPYPNGVDLAGVDFCVETDEVFVWIAHFSMPSQYQSASLLAYFTRCSGELKG